ncbi:unnamed protein product [Ambrosiozyma monospora]|uniref:Unnamed protein product n=1 Tax=Ambrosiozyma monospora TaxID=43982 RepID=A0ACB5UCM5_AMBMO|nr:unnamed protein product [Ambrosiozyma monospora]
MAQAAAAQAQAQAVQHQASKAKQPLGQQAAARNNTGQQLSAKPSNGTPMKKGTGRTHNERRISTLTDAQIMAKLRSVVINANPTPYFQIIEKAGQGASGSVYLAKSLKLGGKQVAIKQMDLSKQSRKGLIVNEILVMKDSHHKNIVNYIEAYLNGPSDLWVIMEFMEGGALTDVCIICIRRISSIVISNQIIS